MCASIFSQIPYPHATRPIAAYDFALIWVNDDVVGRGTVVVAPLYCARPGFPNLDVAILGARYHPFTFAVKGYSSDIARMSLKCKKRIGIRGFDIVQLHCVVAGRGKVPLVGRDT